MIPEAAPFLAAARIARALIADPAVGQSWAGPSALPGFTVGGLAEHLGAQVLLVARALTAQAPALEVVPVLDHYARVTWVTADRDADINVRIRTISEQSRDEGQSGLLARLDETLAALDAELPGADGDRQVAMPAGGWSLLLGDYLLTRMMEIAVHNDDLAVSVDVPTPPLPDEVLSPVLGLLGMLSARRHGQPAVLRALTRAERAGGRITAFGPGE